MTTFRAPLLVDLDGTITDPAPGILGSVEHALERLGLPAPAREELRWVIGPPLRVSFPKLGVAPGNVEQALAFYRERYSAGGLFEADLCDGMDEALRVLKARGHRLFVATSKPHVFARPIIAHFGLADVFEAVHGAELDGTNDAKKDVIASILTGHGIAARECIMVGDTAFDVEGARHHGIPTIGVTWGHGAERLIEAAPAAVISHARDLPDAVAHLSR